MTLTKSTITISKAVWLGFQSGVGGGSLAGLIFCLGYTLYVSLDHGVGESLMGVIAMAMYGFILGATLGTFGGIIGGLLIGIFQLTNHIRTLGLIVGPIAAAAAPLLIMITSLINGNNAEVPEYLFVAAIFGGIGLLGGAIGGYIYHRQLHSKAI